MKHKCLHCYKPLNGEQDYHRRCIRTFFGTAQAPELEYSLNEMADLAKLVVERSVAVPGVQPKLSLTLVKKVTKDAAERLTVVGALGGDYIFKPPSERFAELPQNEHLTMRMAEVFGVNVVPSTLIRLKSGELAYLTKRIDRKEDGSKIHMLDMFQITEAFDKYRSSMERVGKALKAYSSNTLLDLTYLFDLTLFCFLTGNNDMHLKNFSMIQAPSGWSLAPAYDLLNVAIAIPEDREELALTLNGKKRKLGRGDFEQFAATLGLTSRQVSNAFGRFQRRRENALSVLDRSFLSDDLKEAYLRLMDERYRQLG